MMANRSFNQPIVTGCLWRGVTPSPLHHIKGHSPDRYQTVYARTPGSVAAPTAGLHLTKDLLEKIESIGVSIAKIDLVVGLDTFRPVTVDNPADHVMHSERYSVSNETWEACQTAKRVVAVGTTTVRALESAARGPRRAHRSVSSSWISVQNCGFDDDKFSYAEINAPDDDRCLHRSSMEASLPRSFR